ncbi:MAG: hypothetical protein RJB66_116 [Pseudomonadota bacterium]|jgi:geranylgeranyl pyrophosphate synthase
MREQTFGYHELFQLTKISSQQNDPLNDLCQTSLLNPINEFLSRPKKGFRSELINFGYQVAQEFDNEKLKGSSFGEKDIKLFNDVIELIHSGSLIIDDIEDETEIRRGRPTLHKIHGLPLALNAGNWLYFWPLVLIQNSNLQESIKSIAIAECHKTLLLAHTGQAIDIGTNLRDIPQPHITEIVFKSIELKSGALTALSLKLGALAFFNTLTKEQCRFLDQTLDALNDLGLQFGQFLQMHDDIGNLTSANNPQKQYEDLKFMRPTFVWAVLADLCSSTDYHEFVNLIHNQRQMPLFKEAIEPAIERLNLKHLAKTRATELQQQWLNDLAQNANKLSPAAFEQLNTMLERLSHAY